MKLKIFALMFVVVLLIGSVSAWEWDNVVVEGNINPKTGYPNLEIKNALGFGETLFEGKLEEHTKICGIDCYSKIEIIHNGGVLIDDIEFRTIQDDGSYIVQPIRSFKFEYETEDGFEEYIAGEELAEGEYELYLRGEKKPTRTVDWVIKIQGKWLDDWAVWGGDIFTGNEYQLMIIADDLIQSGLEINGVIVTPLTGNNYKINTSNTDDEISRALIMQTFFQGGSNGRATDSYINATWVFSNDIRDNGKRGIFSSISSSGDPDANYNYEGIFENNLTNDDVSSWSSVGGSGSVNNADFILNGTNLNTADGSTTSDEYGTDTSSDDVSNPINTNLLISHFISGSYAANAVILTNGTITWSGGSGASPTNTDFFLDEGFPEMIFPDNTVILDSPNDNEEFDSLTVEFNCSANVLGGGNIINMSLWTNQSGTFQLENSTIGLSGTSNLSSFNHNLETDGNYLWTCQACDSDGDCGFANENRTVLIDTTNPIIGLTSPIGDQGSFVIGNNLSVNWTVSDLNLDSCWFDYNDINTTVTCADNNYSFITIQSKQSLIFYANDTVNNIASDTTSWTYSFLENNITFEEVVFETSNQNFILNLTTDETILSVSGNMIYDDVNYLSTITCDSGNCIMENNIDIPLVVSGVNQTNDFFWNFTIFNGTSSNNIQTSTNQQIVNKTFLEICNGTHTIKTLNFTALDEINLSRINNFQFDSTFNFWIGGGTVKRNNTYSLNATEVNLCMKDDLNYSVDSKIDYDEFGNTTTYTSRFYYMQGKEIDDNVENISLYLLQSAFSTSFILKVQDQNLLPVEEALINIQRCYASEDDCRIVQIAKTDENGKSIGFFQTETVDYKFTIVKNGVTLLQTGLQKVVPETSPFTLTFNVGQDLGAPWKGSEDIVNLNSTLVFNKDAGIVTYVYIDTSTNFTLANLMVTKNSLSNSSATITICNETSNLASSTIFCDVGNTTGFYTASGFITRSGTGLDKQISFQIEDVSSVVGFLGLFYGFFLMLVLIFMFKFNEIAGIWLLVVSIVLLNISGLIKFGMVFVTAIIVLAIIITWLLER